jgi:hypothetical protein
MKPHVCSHSFRINHNSLFAIRDYFGKHMRHRVGIALIALHRYVHEEKSVCIASIYELKYP